MFKILHKSALFCIFATVEDKETINILIAQLLSKDDEILRLRNLLDDLQREQRSGNMQILSKLDRALEELKSMRHDNKTLSNRLSRALSQVSRRRENTGAFQCP